MIYFSLPSSPKNAFENIRIVKTLAEPPIAVSQSVAFYMNEIKGKIATRDKEWDVIKKYTNPYEYIHTIVPLRKKSISKYKPISRSYFKMIEMLAAFRVDVSYATKSFAQLESSSPAIRTFHLAEGPGGFIEAVCNKRTNPEDEYYGMTILYDETDDNVPAWNKTEYFLSKHPNVHIETGLDGTGNIMHLDNFDHCVRKYGSSMDLITADGGFDFSKDFNKQELIITNLLWGQTCYALCMQKYGGNFVLKIFDCFYSHTVDILYLLAGFYKEVCVCKPQTSRLGNSEKYVVCRGFRFSDNRAFLSIIRQSFQIVSRNEQDRVMSLGFLRAKWPTEHVARLLDIPVPVHFVKHVEEMNAVFGQQQIENIHYTISIIDKHAKNDRLEQMTKQNMQKCVAWCVAHGVAYNNFSNTNMFVADARSGGFAKQELVPSESEEESIAAI